MPQEWSAEDRAWQAAYAIAWIGASNPDPVKRSISEYTQALGAQHHAVQAMQGHLDYLNGEGLGPPWELLDEVTANAQRLGVATHANPGPRSAG